MNTITIELCAEDRARLDAILEALLAKPSHTAQPVEPKKVAVPTAREIPAEAKPAEPVKVEATQPEPAPQSAVAPTVNVQDVQELVIRLATTGGKKNEAREIVHEYADRVTNIPSDKLAEAFKRLKALEA